MNARAQSAHLALARTRATVCAAAGIAVGLAVAFTPAGSAAPLTGWTAAAAVFVGWSGYSLWPLDPAETAAVAAREDPSQPIADVVCLLAAVASLVAVGQVLVDAGNDTGTTKLLEIGLAVLAVVVSWFVIHVVFTLKYARYYYGGSEGDIDFNRPEPPCYSDFAYLAFTIGMTFQVSDTDLKTPALRRVALRHMLLSYLMGAVIIGVTINLIAGMTK
jgi:uncharacterized membrane protein